MAKRSPVVLVTGASSGIGRATAAHLAGRGFVVYGTSRKPADGELPYAMLPMDVCDVKSVRDAVARMIDAEGRIDAVVNNAGISITGAIEDATLEEAQRQLDTNFFGVLRVIHAVLPVMRRNRSGRIVNVSSIGGLIGLPFQGLYSASKFALEGLTEALRMEVEPFGIRVVNVNPGDYRTGMTDNRILVEAASASVYAKQLEATLAVYERDERSGGDPIEVARTVERALRARSPKVRYLVGPAGQKLGPWVKGIVGSRLFEGIMRRHAGIRR